MLKVQLSLTLIFLTTLFYSQEKFYPKIDSALYFTSYSFIVNGKLEEGIIFNKKLIGISKKNNYTKGIVWGYCNIGIYLSLLSRYEESLKYFEIAEKDLQKINDFSLKAKLYTNKGKVYYSLGLFNIALEYYNKGINEGKKIEAKNKKKKYLHFVYSCKADSFEALKQIDSQYIYLQRAYKQDLTPGLAAGIARYFIRYKKNELDSADYYLREANEELRKKNYEIFQKLIILKEYGNFYFEKKEYDKALNSYLKALIYAKQMNNKEQLRDIYQSLSSNYKALKKYTESEKYFQKYTNVDDSLNASDKPALNLSVDKLLRKKEQEKKDVENKSYTKFIFLQLIIALIIVLGFIFYFKKKKERESIIHKQQEEIAMKEEEKKELEYKINDAFEEVTQLAKQNDPLFLTRFKEVYPEFCEKLLETYPDILNSELTFLAYIKLNFSSKEIATFTFVTIKAVQTRKTRLRKKFNIPSDVDLYIWIKKI